MTIGAADKTIIVEACRELVHRAALAVDSQDYLAFAGLFTEDGVLRRPGGQPLQGRAAIVASYQARPPGKITRHLISNTVVDVVSESRATGHSSVLLWSGQSADVEGAFGRPADARQVVGEFIDEFTRTPEGWKISQRSSHFLLYRES